MVDARASQRSFTAGELSPDLYGRKDFAKYQIGCRFLQNCFVHAYGGISNRPGLHLVTEVKDSAKHVRLGKFEAAADDAYLLEIGDLYFRPIFAGAYVDAGGGTPLEIVTPYAQTDIDLLYMEQSNDVATIVQPDFAPRELSRSAPLVWNLATVTFQPLIGAPTGQSATGTNAYTGYGADQVPTSYSYKVAAVADTGEESLPSGVATNATPVVLGYDANYVTVAWSAVAGAVEYVVYKADNGVYGFIGTTPNLSFKDDNIAPSFASGPQEGANPFAGTGDYPSLTTFVQGRRGFFATDNKPQTSFLSQSGNFNNMGVSSPARDDDAVTFTLAAQRKQDIFHVVPLERGMIMFTRSGEWRVTGSNDDVITPSSILPEPQSYYGSSPDMSPLVVGQELLFCSRSARTVRNMEYSLQVDKYVSADLSLLSKHLFRNRTIVAWDYAEEPDGIIWCVMSDGEALSLTYLRDQEVWGWGRHHTAGKFLDVKVIPETTRNTPYFLIQRIIGGATKQFIEYLETRDFVEIEDAFFVDSGLKLDDPHSITALAVGTSTRATSAAHGLSNGTELRINNVGVIDDLGNTTYPVAGRYFTGGVTTDQFYLVDQNGDDIDTSEYTGLLYDGHGVWREAFDTVTGLDHLEGRRIVCLCDGSVVEDLVVTGGQVVLPHKFGRVVAGLQYIAVMTTLDLLNPQADDTGTQKAVPKVYLRVKDTRGIAVCAGLDPNLAEELPSRSFENYGEPNELKNGLLPVTTWSSWGTEQFLTIVQKYPLPMTLTGITDDIEYGG